jgi:hypothetical protein
MMRRQRIPFLRESSCVQIKEEREEIRGGKEREHSGRAVNDGRMSF